MGNECILRSEFDERADDASTDQEINELCLAF